MSKEELKSLILSLEGLKRREWEDIKNYIDKQYDHQFFYATKDQALAIDKDFLEWCMKTMRSLANKNDEARG